MMTRINYLTKVITCVSSIRQRCEEPLYTGQLRGQKLGWKWKRLLDLKGYDQLVKSLHLSSVV